MMENYRPSKRARQACEPCRRKKSKCPGEKPECSYCVRLGHQCVYAAGESEERPNRRMDDRMNNLEDKLDLVLKHLGPAVDCNNMGAALLPLVVQSRPPETPTGRQRCESFTPEISAQSIAESSIGSLLTHKGLTREAGHLYLTWCHNQPLALFAPEGFLESLATRDRELILALQSLSLRYPPGALTTRRNGQLEAMAEASRRLVGDRVSEGTVELSTLQTLCLLGMVDFAGGKIAQASLHITIAKHLIARLLSSLNPFHSYHLLQNAEFKMCARSIEMLHNLQQSVLPMARSVEWASPPSNQLDLPRLGADQWPRIPREDTENHNRSGILTYTAQLSEVWQLARAYVASKPKEPDAPPPWLPQSDYSHIMARHLQIDSQVPLGYRYHPNRFQDCDAAELQGHRNYWGPWLFLQFVYAAIPCLLNHPFVLSLHLRGFRHFMPQSFIQQSFEQITRHAGWIVHFLDLLESKSYVVSDPVLAHCVAVIATIHLQHSFVQDEELRSKAQSGFEKCMTFLSRVGMAWPNVKIMENKLKRLQDKIVTVVDASQPGSVAAGQGSDAGQRWSIEGALLWDILIYETAGLEDHSGAMTCIFGESLLPPRSRKRVAPGEDPCSSTPTQTYASEAKFDLIGSVGISGHKTVDKETPAYPPGHIATPLSMESRHQRVTATAAQAAVSSGLGPAFGESPNFLQAMGGSLDQANSFFSANDFGRAIDTWLDFDTAP